MRKVGSEWHGPCPACGTSQGDPAKSDRFTVKPDGRFFCRTCTPDGGDAIEFLRKFDGLTCPEAHAALGKDCTSTTCPVIEKCSKGQGKERRNKEDKRAPKIAKQGPEWQPQGAVAPPDQWQANARKLVDWSHHRLLKEQDVLSYLEKRGIDLKTVKKHQLGWWPETKFRPLSEWGLPEEKNPKTGRSRRVWIPRGIIIPTVHGGSVQRIRVRRHREDLADGRGKYIAIKGSGDEVSIIGAGRKAYVIVESDLDGLLIDRIAGDIVGCIPLTSCSVKPRTSAHTLLKESLAILVALDFEPRQNEQTGRYENPGGQSAQWWLTNFDQAQRWPVPAGKDPGEAYEQGTDLREWILAGLPPAFHVVPKEPKPEIKPAEKKTQDAAEVDPDAVHGTSHSGHPYIISDRHSIRRQADCAAFSWREIKMLRGMTPEQSEHLIQIKEAFGNDAKILKTKRLGLSLNEKRRLAKLEREVGK
jgi:hypothetical protein